MVAVSSLSKTSAPAGGSILVLSGTMDRWVCFGPYAVAGGVPRVFPDLSAAGVVHQVFGYRYRVYVVRLAVPVPV